MPDAKGTYGIKFTNTDSGDIYLAFKAPKALYETIAAALGLEDITTPAQLSKAIIAPAAMYCNRVGITYKHTSGNRSGSIWCAKHKLEDVLKDPPTKYRTYDVIKAFQPLDTNRS